MWMFDTIWSKLAFIIITYDIIFKSEYLPRGRLTDKDTVKFPSALQIRAPNKAKLTV